MKKIFGYISATVGLIGVAIWAIPQLETPVQSVYKSIAGAEATLNLTFILILGIALTILGLVIIKKGGRKKKAKISEVPIFEGENLVGYRRHSNK